MITAIPDWLILVCAIVGAWFLLSVVVVSPLLVLVTISRRYDRRCAEAALRAEREVVAEAERIANGLSS